MNACAEENNSYTENICQIIIPFNTLKEFILVEDTQLPFKLEYAKFLFNVHLDSKEMMRIDQIEIILPILNVYSKDILKYSSF